MIDFTVTEYVQDSSLLNKNIAILSLGHFNLEELGMRYMKKYLKELFPSNMQISYIQAEDMYDYVTIN